MHEMHFSPRSSSTDPLRTVGSLVSAAWLAIAATLNAVTVATAYWSLLSVKGYGESASAHIGLWRVCARETLGGESQCFDISNPSVLGFSDETAYLYAARALSITALAMCLVSVPLAIAGYASNKENLVFGAAVVAFIQCTALATALLVFLLKIWTNAASQWKNYPDIDLQVTPGWSFYVGGIGVIVYFAGSLFYGITGILMRQGNNRAGENNVSTFANGVSAQEVGYKPLDEIPPAQIL